jgi:hypothetical protein
MGIVLCSIRVAACAACTPYRRPMVVCIETNQFLSNLPIHHLGAQAVRYLPESIGIFPPSDSPRLFRNCSRTRSVFLYTLVSTPLFTLARK